MDVSKHYVNALEEYNLFLKEKYGDNWLDSMLTEYERMTINGFRFASLCGQSIIQDAPPAD